MTYWIELCSAALLLCSVAFDGFRFRVGRKHPFFGAKRVVCDKVGYEYFEYFVKGAEEREERRRRSRERITVARFWSDVLLFLAHLQLPSTSTLP